MIDSTPSGGKALLPGAALLSTICGAAVCGIGILALLGWILQDDALKSLGWGNISVKTNTAIALILAGCSLFLLAPPRISTLRCWAGRVLAGAVIGIGFATMVQHLFGVDLGIDQFLFREEAGAAATQSPNRMGPPASISFPLLGGALLLLHRRTRGGRSPSQYLALTVVLIALVPLLGYVFGASLLYGIARYTGIAFHTALAFLLLSIGILAARPDLRPMSLLTADDTGGFLLRRMLPGAILLPIVLGWLRVRGQAAGLYDLDFGRALLILSFILAFSALTWWTAAVISRHAAARAEAESAKDRMQEHLAVALQSERGARAAAERSNRMKDEFLAMLSHELRTPLHAILGWAQVLGRVALPDEARRGVESIERNSKLQAQLIDDLLDMSRIVSGKVQLDVQIVDLPLLLESSIAEWKPAAETKGVALDRSIDGAVGSVQGDPARLQQVLGNVIMNAIKFTPAGGRAAIRVRTDGAYVEVQVCDTGIGIHPDMLDSIFDPFRQANASTTREYGGLGLGLSIARQLTELHGGTIRAESDGDGKGASFTIRLPASTPSVSALVQDGLEGAAPKPAAERAPASLDRVRVLAVDDQADARELVEHVLRASGAEVVLATSAGEAMALLEESRPFDVLISDIGMPARDGYDLIRDIRTRHGDIPAIALTAFAREDDRLRAEAAGYRVYLAKPVHPTDLVAAVARLAAAQPR